MYAILQHGGHQYRVASGDRIVVDRLPAEVGEVIGLAPVLLVADDDRFEAQGQGLEGVRVAATVVAHMRGRKLRVFTYKPKKRHRRTLGFRAELTELLVERVLTSGEALPEPSPAGAAATPETPSEAAGEAVEAAAPAAPARRRGRRAAAAAAEEVTEDQSVAEAWGEAEPPRAAEPSPQAPAEEAPSAPEAAAEGEAPPRRRRPRASSPAEKPSGEDQPPAGSEGGTTGRAPRRRVSRREAPGEEQTE